MSTSIKDTDLLDRIYRSWGKDPDVFLCMKILYQVIMSLESRIEFMENEHQILLDKLNKPDIDKSPH